MTVTMSTLLGWVVSLSVLAPAATYAVTLFLTREHVPATAVGALATIICSLLSGAWIAQRFDKADATTEGPDRRFWQHLRFASDN